MVISLRKAIHHFMLARSSVATGLTKIPRAALTCLGMAIKSTLGTTAVDVIKNVPWVHGTNDERFGAVTLQARRLYPEQHLIAVGLH